MMASQIRFKVKKMYLMVSKRNSLYLFEDWTENHTRDHHVSFLGKPCDIKRESSGQILLSHPQTHDGSLYMYYIIFGLLRLTIYLIETPFNTFANRANPDQAALLRAA